MKLFLTGATGNCGHAVAAELVRRGHEVVALVRRPIEVAGCTTVVADLGDIDAFRDEIAVVEGIIHLASPRSTVPEIVLNDDIVATLQLLDAWERGPFVYTSSQTVYGVPKGPLTEQSPLDAHSWYDIGKITNEFQIRAAELDGRNRGPAVRVRMALLFGVGARRNDRQFLPSVVEACRAGATFVCTSEEGLATFGSSFIGEEDFGRAIADSVAIRTSGPYNLAGGFVTWKELVASIDRALGTRSSWVIRADGIARDGEFRLPQSRSVVDATAFVTSTGWKAQQTSEELVDRYVQAEARSRA